MSPEALLIWIAVGIVAGWLASQVVPSSYGIVGDTVVGMVGALVGGLLFDSAADPSTSFSIISVFVAFIGAVILLVVLRGLRHVQT